MFLIRENYWKPYPILDGTHVLRIRTGTVGSFPYSFFSCGSLNENISIWASCLGKDTELGAFTSIRLDASDGSQVRGQWDGLWKSIWSPAFQHSQLVVDLACAFFRSLTFFYLLHFFLRSYMLEEKELDLRFHTWDWSLFDLWLLWGFWFMSSAK